MIIRLYKRKIPPLNSKLFYIDSVSPLGINLYEHVISDGIPAIRYNMKDLDNFNMLFEFADVIVCKVT